MKYRMVIKRTTDGFDIYTVQQKRFLFWKEASSMEAIRWLIDRVKELKFNKST